MTIVDMLGQSGLLTALGMGVVFSFIIIMIICMYILHAVLHALGKDVDEVADKPAASSSAPAQDNGAVVAAIATALKNK